MKKVLIISAGILVTAFGCSKDKRDIKFRGRVYDELSGTLLTEGTIDVYITYADKASGASMNRGGGDCIINSDGTFEMIVNDQNSRHEVDKKYTLTVHSDTWSYTNGYTFGVSYDDRNDVNHDIPLHGVGHLYVIAHNTTPFDANDQLTGYYWQSAGDIVNAPTYTGTNVNDTFRIISLSGTKILHSSIVKNSIVTSRTDTISIPGFANTYYHLDY